MIWPLRSIATELFTKKPKPEIVDPTKSNMYINSNFIGIGPKGHYVHSTGNGRATYHPAYYAQDGKLLGY